MIFWTGFVAYIVIVAADWLVSVFLCQYGF